mmetsp:Transcript_138132/g.311325  ORF Transcript_138132/g.311325 Transcript_138132/m.311325 type:complete len:83 (+) Transcript_138132:152-400(+)
MVLALASDGAGVATLGLHASWPAMWPLVLPVSLSDPAAGSASFVREAQLLARRSLTAVLVGQGYAGWPLLEARRQRPPLDVC